MMKRILLIYLIITLVIPQNGFCLRPPATARSPKNINLPKHEFNFSAYDEDGNVLFEPSGFPGDFTVELRIKQKEETNAAVERLVKSFSLSAHKCKRTDINRARFTITPGFSRCTGPYLFKNDLFAIKSSDIFGLEILVSPSFLKTGISGQRKIFSDAIKSLPVQKSLSKKIDFNDTTVSLSDFSAVVFSSPIRRSLRGSQPLTPSAFSIASLLRSEGMDCDISDFEFSPKDEEWNQAKAQISLNQLLKSKDMVCLSLYDGDFASTLDFIKMIRKANPDIIIAVGGPSAIISPEHVLAHIPDVNIVFRGEAEVGFIPLLKGIVSAKQSGMNARSLHEALSGSQGAAVHFGKFYHFCNLLHVNRMTEQELNNRVFDFSLLNENNIDGIFPLMTSLGCPFRCVFCAIASGKKYRAMSPVKVIELLEAYQARLEEIGEDKVPEQAWVVTMADDDFFFDEDRAKEIMRLWRERGLKLKLNPDPQTSLSSLLKKPGKHYVVNTELLDYIMSYADIFNGNPMLLVGVDALLNEEMRRLNKAPYGKDINYEQLIDELFSACHERGLRLEPYLISTNQEITFKNFILTLLRAYYYSVKYYNAIVAFPTNLTMHTNLATPVMNDLIRRKDPCLYNYSALAEQRVFYTGRIKGFVEYDDYRTIMPVIYPKEIPAEVIFAAELARFTLNKMREQQSEIDIDTKSLNLNVISIPQLLGGILFTTIANRHDPEKLGLIENGELSDDLNNNIKRIREAIDAMADDEYQELCREMFSVFSQSLLTFKAMCRLHRDRPDPAEGMYVGSATEPRIEVLISTQA